MKNYFSNKVRFNTGGMSLAPEPPTGDEERKLTYTKSFTGQKPTGSSSTGNTVSKQSSGTGSGTRPQPDLNFKTFRRDLDFSRFDRNVQRQRVSPTTATSFQRSVEDPRIGLRMAYQDSKNKYEEMLKNQKNYTDAEIAQISADWNIAQQMRDTNKNVDWESPLSRAEQMDAVSQGYIGRDGNRVTSFAPQQVTGQPNRISTYTEGEGDNQTTRHSFFYGSGAQGRGQTFENTQGRGGMSPEVLDYLTRYGVFRKATNNGSETLQVPMMDQYDFSAISLPDSFNKGTDFEIGNLSGMSPEEQRMFTEHLMNEVGNIEGVTPVYDNETGKVSLSFGPNVNPNLIKEIEQKLAGDSGFLPKAVQKGLRYDIRKYVQQQQDAQKRRGGRITFKQGGKILSNLITNYVNKRKV